MTTLYSSVRDRSRASEHAVVLWRDLYVPARDAAKLLPGLGKRLQGKLSLIVPGSATTLPIALMLTSAPQASDWRIELRFSSPAGVRHFFEGHLRLENVSPRAARVMLLGRFAFPRDEVPEHVDEATLRDIAEDNVICIFERLLLEIESATAVAASKAR